MSKTKATHDKNDKPGTPEHEQTTAGQQTSDTKATQARQSSQLAPRDPFGFATSAPLSPFSFMRRFSEEMDRLFDDFGFGGLGLAAPGRGAGWSPQVEMFQREGKLVVRADLPGLTKDDVKVDLDDGAITIHGERRSEHEENREGYFRTERSYGSFVRRIPLPPGVDGHDAKASFRNGVLEIEMKGPLQKSRGRTLDIS